MFSITVSGQTVAIKALFIAYLGKPGGEVLSEIEIFQYLPSERMNRFVTVTLASLPTISRMRMSFGSATCTFSVPQKTRPIPQVERL
jgi:hypothetical protein